MRMIFQIELGEGMQTGADVIAALKDSLKGEERLKLEPGVGGRLWTKSGDTVGAWHTSKHAQDGSTEPHVLIELQGGLVQWVGSTVPLDYTVLDFDTEGADPDELNKVPTMLDPPDNIASAYVTGDSAQVDPDRVNRVLKAIAKQDAEPESETRYRNYYVHCKTEWNDEWSCCCNDECPKCGGEIEPYASEDQERGETLMHVGAAFVPEDGFPDGITNAAALDGWDAEQFKPGPEHQADSDCTVDTETRLCVTCGVFHGRVTCRGCGGAAFHKEGCAELKALEAAL